MRCITIKKPVFVGVYASFLAMRGERKGGGDTFRKAKCSARREVAQHFLDQTVKILSVFGRRMVLTDPLPPSLPDGVFVECEGRLSWVGEDGTIIVAVGEE